MRADCFPPFDLSRRMLIGGLPAAVLMRAAPTFAQGEPRVVSLDYGLASTLLALGIVPAGVSDLAGWDKWVVAPSMPAGVADLGSSTEPNLEILKALKPDFILVTPYLDAQIPL
jgi:iron complex transport system substrate-binding protein